MQAWEAVTLAARCAATNGLACLSIASPHQHSNRASPCLPCTCEPEGAAPSHPPAMRPSARSLRQRRAQGGEEPGPEGQQEAQPPPGLHTPHFTTSADLEASYDKTGSPREAGEEGEPDGEPGGSPWRPGAEGRLPPWRQLHKRSPLERCCSGSPSRPSPIPLTCTAGAAQLQGVGVEGDALDQLARQAASPPQPLQPPPSRAPAGAAAAAATAAAGAAREGDALDAMMR